MNLLLCGVSHKTAPVALREKLACLIPDVAHAYDHLKGWPEVSESLLYTTCNRVEVMCVTEAPDDAAGRVRDFFARHPEIAPGDLDDSFYVHRDQAAVQHFFRVAASLDSMVVGEPQILGQVKQAYREAAEHHATGPILNRLVHKAFSVAKRVRGETGIGDHAVSVSYAAIAMAKKIFGDLAGKNVLLVGAGEMAELALEHLKGQGAGKITVANRTLARGVALARRFRGEAVSLEELPEQLLFADILISSTGAGDLLLTRDQVKGVMRRRKQRPLFLIDIAVPRDLDPAINDLDNVYLYNIDDLNEVVQQGWQQPPARSDQGRAPGGRRDPEIPPLAGNVRGLPHHYRLEGQGRGHLPGGAEKDLEPVGSSHAFAAPGPGGLDRLHHPETPPRPHHLPEAQPPPPQPPPGAEPGAPPVQPGPRTGGRRSRKGLEG